MSWTGTVSKQNIPGIGMSFETKQAILNAILNTGDDVFIIDPDREYSPLVESLGGETIKISVGGKNHINPFDMDIQYDEDNSVALKSDFIQSLCETIMGGKYGLSPTQKSIIDRCVRTLYQPYLQEMAMHSTSDTNTCIYELMPTLDEFCEMLLAQPQQEAHMLALALEIYAIGSADIFSYETNLNVKSRLLTYDLHNIGINMKETGLLVCLNDCWNRIVANKRKGTRTLLFVQTKTSVPFLQKISKYARKWQVIQSGNTQNILLYF